MCEETETGMRHADNAGRQSQRIALATNSAKLFAIGELIKFRSGEPSLDEVRFNWGLGELLTDLANEISSI